jgi:Na+/alanine symporter
VPNIPDDGAMMALPNLVVLVFLSGEIVLLKKEYFDKNGL